MFRPAIVLFTRADKRSSAMKRIAFSPTDSHRLVDRGAIVTGGSI
jgi:hypothetical protein